MAKLTAQQRQDLAAEFMRRLSAARVQVPLTKAQFSQLVGLFDDELEQAEIDIVTRVPAGPARQWLIANAPITRQMLTETEEARKAGL